MQKSPKFIHRVLFYQRLLVVLATSSRISVYFGWSRVLQTSSIGLSKEGRTDVCRNCQCQKHVQRKSLHWWGNIDLSYRNSDIWEYRDNLIRNSPKKLVNWYYPLPVYFSKSLVSVSWDLQANYRFFRPLKISNFSEFNCSFIFSIWASLHLFPNQTSARLNQNKAVKRHAIIASIRRAKLGLFEKKSDNYTILMENNFDHEYSII